MIKISLLVAVGALTVCQPAAAPEAPAPSPSPTVDVKVETREARPEARDSAGIDVKTDKDGTSIDFKIEKK